MMNRRAFIATFVVSLAAPAIPALPGAGGAVVRARLWAVGNDEHHYPFFAETLDQALREYAHEYGARIGDECPVCAECDCTVHNDESELDDPLPHIEGYTFPSWEEYGPGQEPPLVAWVRVGYNVRCEGDCGYAWDDPIECYEYRGKALCCECLEQAKIAELERIIAA